MAEPKSDVEGTGLDRKYTPPTFNKICAIAVGGLLTNAMFMAAFRIQLYGLKVLGLTVIMVAVYMTLFTIIDVVNDIFIGRFSDKSKRFTKRFGKRFIFIIIGTIGTAIAIILPFLPIWEVKPGGGLVNQEHALLAIIWIAVTVSIWDCFQTFEELNSKALIPGLIRDQKSRARLQLVATVTGTVGLVIGILSVPILISVFGGASDPNAFFLMGIVIAIIYLMVLPIRAYGIREPKEMREFRYELDELKEKEPFWDAMKRAIKNRNWIAFVITYFQYALTLRIFSLGIDIYVVDGLGMDIAYSALPQLGMLIGFFLFGLISYKLLRKYGAKRTYLIGTAITVIGYFLIVFTIDIWTLTLFSFFAGLGIGAQGISRELMNNQAIDDATLKYGKREEAQYNAVNQIFSATAKAWGAIIFAIIAVVFMYDPLLGYEGNTELAKIGLLYHISIVPMIICAITGLLVWKFFDITKEKAVENKEKLLKLGL